MCNDRTVSLDVLGDYVCMGGHSLCVVDVWVVISFASRMLENMA